MKCDELKGAVEAGAEISNAGWEHAEACPRCREEFAHLRALRASAPEAPAGLRARVMEAAFPARRPAFGWPALVAAAAAVVLAFVGGIAYGRESGKKITPPVGPVPVAVQKETVVPAERIVEKPSRADDGDLFLLALALEQVYKKQVRIEYDGVSCKAIHADKSVCDMVPYCPIARKLWVAACERPDVVDFQK